MEIKKISGEVIFALEGAKTVLEVVESAVEAKKSLIGANLRYANLRGAYLVDVNLRGAYLGDACLIGANLSDVNLSEAYLSDANLRDVNLRGAYLSDANLRDVNLRGAYLSDACLIGANLRGANLIGAYLRGAYLGELEGVPVIPDIHKAVYEAASKPKAMDMGEWHTCATTHCRAGWVIALAGAGGAALEWALGTSAAAAVIYMASDPTLEKIPDFYANDEEALEDMKRLAEAAQ